MQPIDHPTLRSALLTELSRMKKLGFLIADEDFEIAQSIDLATCGGMPLTEMACLASERGFEKFKSRLQCEGLL